MVFDRGTDVQYCDLVIVTFASYLLSTFDITVKVRTAGDLKHARQTFYECSRWTLGGLRYLD